MLCFTFKAVVACMIMHFICMGKSPELFIIVKKFFKKIYYCTISMTCEADKVDYGCKIITVSNIENKSCNPY